MRQELVERVRGWATRRKVLVYLIAQSTLLGLIAVIVRTWIADVPALAHLGPWLGAAVGGLGGILLGSKRLSP
ncbi:hypothetical protein AB0467_29180 [Streptomyces sp. NPDC052095]|uniref:hypothetical protein n=1 Tax=unclassified Streptomyces TaxID=2593676 RepID=UPI00344FA2C3